MKRRYHDKFRTSRLPWQPLLTIWNKIGEAVRAETVFQAFYDISAYEKQNDGKNLEELYFWDTLTCSVP